MKNTLLMSIDLGTSFIKAAVYDPSGAQLAVSQSPVRSETPEPGVFLQSGEAIYESVLSAMKDVTSRLGDKSRDIAAIGFTGQMAGFMGVDKDWNDVSSWSCSLDTRYVPYADEQMRTMSTDFLEISGTNAPLMAPKCRWFVSEFPEKARRIAKYMLISSYVLGRLAETDVEQAALSSSYITWTGLADVRKKTWSKDLCEKSGISEDLLPVIADYDAVAGRLSKAAAYLTGLPAGIPLAAGAGDKIAGCIGAGILTPGDTIFETSSYGAVSVLAESYRPNPARYDYDAIPAYKDGQFYLHRYFPGSGITLKWFVDTFLDGVAEKERFQLIEQSAAALPCGSEGLMAVGMLGGSAMPFDGALRGAWIGHTWSHGKAHFYRALLESFACELALTMDSIHTMYPEWNRHTDVKLIGGGAHSQVWPQILADFTGCAMTRLARDDDALWGGAILAGASVGVFSDVKAVAAAGNRTTAATAPDPGHQAVYRKYQSVYEAVLRQVSSLSAQIQKEGLS